MTPSTIERAYELAQSGRFATLAELQLQLREDGCRAVDALLAPRGIRGHLEAICTASTRAAPIAAD